MTQALAQRSTMDLFNPERYAVLERMATQFLASGMLPSSLKQPAQVITIMLKAHEIGVPPLEGLNSIAVIQGKPTVSPQLMLALIERSGAGSISILERGENKSIVETRRKGRNPVQFVFTFDDAKKLGLSSKDNYQKQPAVMLQWRNIAAAARAVFPDVISGMYTPEEMGAEVEILEDGTQIVTVVPEITEAKFTPALPAGVQKGVPAVEPLTDLEKQDLVMVKAHIVDHYGITDARVDEFYAYAFSNPSWRKSVATIRKIQQRYTDGAEPHYENIDADMGLFQVAHPDIDEGLEDTAPFAGGDSK